MIHKKQYILYKKISDDYIQGAGTFENCCNQNGISKQTFYNIRKRIEKNDSPKKKIGSKSSHKHSRSRHSTDIFDKTTTDKSSSKTSKSSSKSNRISSNLPSSKEELKNIDVELVSSGKKDGFPERAKKLTKKERDNYVKNVLNLRKNI